MEKGRKNQRETLYFSKGKIVYVEGKPCNIYRLQGNTIVIIGLSIDIAGKTYKHPVKTCKRLQFIIYWHLALHRHGIILTQNIG
jgi:hypothetical protein